MGICNICVYVRECVCVCGGGEEVRVHVSVSVFVCKNHALEQNSILPICEKKHMHKLAHHLCKELDRAINTSSAIGQFY